MKSTSSVDLAGRRLLVVEDQFLIAMDIEQMLRALGADTVGHAKTVPDALATVEHTPPDIAVLTMKLTHGTTRPVAELLRSRNIPFIVVTGYELAAIAAPFSGAPIVRKPLELDMLASALARLSL